MRFMSQGSEHLSKRWNALELRRTLELWTSWHTIRERKLDTKDKLIDENGNVAENKIYYIIRHDNVDGGRILTYITHASCDFTWTWSIVVIIIMWYSSPADTVPPYCSRKSFNRVSRLYPKGYVSQENGSGVHSTRFPSQPTHRNEYELESLINLCGTMVFHISGKFIRHSNDYYEFCFRSTAFVYLHLVFFLFFLGKWVDCTYFFICFRFCVNFVRLVFF